MRSKNGFSGSEEGEQTLRTADAADSEFIIFETKKLWEMVRLRAGLFPWNRL